MRRQVRPLLRNGGGDDVDEAIVSAELTPSAASFSATSGSIHTLPAPWRRQISRAAANRGRARPVPGPHPGLAEPALGSGLVPGKAHPAEDLDGRHGPQVGGIALPSAHSTTASASRTRPQPPPVLRGPGQLERPVKVTPGFGGPAISRPAYGQLGSRRDLDDALRPVEGDGERVEEEAFGVLPPAL